MRRIDRFVEYMKIKGLNDNKVTLECELSQGLIGQARSGKSDLGPKTIDKILKIYQDLNRVWLLTGEGTMLLNEPQDTSCTKGSNVKGIPLIPIEAIAGLPSIDDIGVLFTECNQYVIPEFDGKGVDYMIRVSGSSMYPKYSNGDILACRYIRDILFIQWGKIYVIDSSQGALVKRVFQDDNNPDNLILVSDNKENYPPFTFPKSDIRSLSIVVGVIRLE